MTSAWLELLVGLLLIAGGLFSLIGALGLIRLPDFFQRMHPVALLPTFACACVTLASVLFFTDVNGRLALYPVLVPLLLAVTLPVTTVLLARAALFRRRAAGDDLPPAFGPSGDAAGSVRAAAGSSPDPSAGGDPPSG